jgi:hypothetical protein
LWSKGYWDNAKMLTQTEDYMDAFETVYPDMQMVVQFDWSSGHAAGSGDGLNVNKMNSKWGGKNSETFSMRDSVLTAEMIGPHPATMKVNGIEVDCKLKAGDAQSFRFGVSVDGQPPVMPPFYDLDACHVDIPASDGDGGAEKCKQGFEGKPKGMQQVMFETGWWDPDPAVKMVGSMPTLNPAGKRKDNGKEGARSRPGARQPAQLPRRAVRARKSERISKFFVIQILHSNACTDFKLTKHFMCMPLLA